MLINLPISNHNIMEPKEHVSLFDVAKLSAASIKKY